MGSQLLTVDKIYVQHGRDRFEESPLVALGRNNLTALSQDPDVNLYFVAELDDILVFRPSFPDQSLAPLLYKWHLPASRPNLPGYINQLRPHAVNSLLVARLGTYEVLVCACDDGDVVMYYLHDIQSFTKEVGAFREGTPRPLMLSNVGRSAWGLAVHTNARKLAVSSNTHAVTVYSYALTDDSVLYDNPDEWQYPGRSIDDLLSLKAHAHNIPSVAFFNSDRDKEGRWLVSTDLRGMIVIWDLRDRCARTKIVPHESSIHPNPRSGWSVSCIDLSAFLLVKSAFDLLGCTATKDDQGTYDITFRHNPPAVILENGALNDEHSDITSIGVQMDIDLDQIHNTDENRSADEQMADSFSDESDLDNESEQDQQSITLSPSSLERISTSIGSSWSHRSMRDVAEQNSTSPSSRHLRDLKALTENRRIRENTMDNTIDPLAPFILVHTGQDFVTMQKAPFVSLTAVSRDPCHQHFSPYRSWQIPHDRLHLTRVIPELNLFITATAAARVAIFTLTRRVSNVKGHIHDQYGMRLEHILPYLSPPEHVDEPADLLIGLATAPIQSSSMCSSGVMGRPRWRLSLTYSDHTVFNYELYRSTALPLLESFI